MAGKRKQSHDPNAGKPLGPTGVFVACSLNGDAHSELVALEIQRTMDVRKRIRHNAFCPFCSTRKFLNNWVGKHPRDIKGPPHTGTMNIAHVLQLGLHPAKITEEREAELLAELGLQRRSPHGPPGPAAWHRPKPPIVPSPRPPQHPPRRSALPVKQRKRQ